MALLRARRKTWLLGRSVIRSLSARKEGAVAVWSPTVPAVANGRHASSHDFHLDGGCGSSQWLYCCDARLRLVSCDSSRFMQQPGVLFCWCPYLFPLSCHGRPLSGPLSDRRDRMASVHTFFKPDAAPPGRGSDEVEAKCRSRLSHRRKEKGNRCHRTPDTYSKTTTYS